MERSGTKICVLCFCSASTVVECKDGNDDLSTIFKLIESNSGRQRDQRGLDSGAFVTLETTVGCKGREQVMTELPGKSQLTVCFNCHNFTSRALESKLKVKDLEVEVRLLQHQLLRLLHKLRKEVDFFSQEMMSIKGTILKSTGSFSNDVHGKSHDKVLRVREKMLEVVTDLRLFQSELSDKLIDSHSNGKDEATVSGVINDIEAGAFVPDTVEEVEILTCDADASLVENVSVECELEEADEDSNLAYTGYLGHYILGGPGISENRDSYTEENDSYLETSFQHTHIPEKKPHSPISKKSGTKEHWKEAFVPKGSPFKRNLIKRAMEREIKRKTEDGFHENPLIKYFLRYDKRTDSFFVGNVRLKLWEGNHNSKQETRLECTGLGCDAYWVPPSGNHDHATTFDRDVRNHVIGKHLGGFSCRVCNLILDSYFKLISHFKKQHPGQKPLTDLETGCKRVSNSNSIRDQYFIPSTTNANQHTDNHKDYKPSRCSSLDRFRIKSAKRIKATAQKLVPPPPPQVSFSPSESMRQVRITMTDAIESLCDSNSAQPLYSSSTILDTHKKKLKTTQKSQVARVSNK